MSQTSISNSLLNVLLVVAESVMTLVLRFDPDLRRAAYPLAKKNTIVHIRSYLPHIQIYAVFTPKGILLDSELPMGHDQADVVVNAYSHQLLNSLVSNDVTLINKLTMRGAAETVAEVRLFLIQLGIVSLFQGIIKTFKGNTSTDQKDPDVKKTTDITVYKARVKEQQEQLNALSIRNRELEISIKEQQSKLKTIMIALGVACLVAVAAIIGIFIL